MKKLSLVLSAIGLGAFVTLMIGAVTPYTFDHITANVITASSIAVPNPGGSSAVLTLTGNSVFTADGAGSLANGLIVWDGSGNLLFNGDMASIAADGSINGKSLELASTGRTRFLTDGSGQLASGKVSIAADGATIFGDEPLSGGRTAGHVSLLDVDGNETILLLGSSGAVSSLYERFGSGSPEGVVAAPVGAIYHRTDGSIGQKALYVKEDGSGDTGWIAK